MIDTMYEELLPMSEAARQLGVSMTTIWRWRLRGCRGRRLETVAIGKKIFTSLAAIQRFSVQSPAAEIPQPRSPRRRQKDIARAERELSEAGI